MKDDRPGMRVVIALCMIPVAAASCRGGGTSPSDTTAAPSVPVSAMTLASPVGGSGGTLPAEYTCDGAGNSPELSWAGAPSGTREFALLMTTLPGDGTTKWNWLLYGIPASATGLGRNSSGVGINGVGSDGPTAAYQPPCSQGPGAKIYTFTIYALSAPPALTVQASQVTGAVLTAAIAPITLGSASLNLSYTRPK
jgi:phosphatidylethanolamine-binding protein (PEBP) family uncharacterized protein